MLADQVNEWPKRREVAFFGAENVHAYEEFARGVSLAPRFDLQRDAVFLIENLSRTVMPSRIIDALPLCRLPYPKMWVEFTFRDRTDWVQIANKEGRYNQSDWGEDTHAQPSRIGFLLEDVSDGNGYRIEAKFVWSWGNTDLLNFCTRSLVIDLEPRPLITLTDEELEKENTVQGKNSWAEAWRNNRVEEVAAVDLTRRITCPVPRHVQPMAQMVLVEDGEQAFNALLASADYDLAGEWKFITAILMVLNSRNVIEYGDEVTYDKLNKARAKKGKEALLSHRPINLHLSRAQYSRMGMSNAAGGRSGAAGDIRPHLVRGHWKLRKTGLFFWSTHMRKEESEASPPTYRVHA